MPIGSAEQLLRHIDRHTMQRLRAEDALARSFYRVMERARGDMFGRLLAFEERWGTTSRFTPAFLQRAIDELDGALDEMAVELTEELAGVMQRGYLHGQRQTAKEIGAMERGFDERFTPRPPTEAMLNLIEGRSAFLRQHTSTMKQRFADQMRQAAAQNAGRAAYLERAGASAAAVREAIAAGLAAGEGFGGRNTRNSIAYRLMHPKTGDFPRLAYKQALITARLSVNDAYNEGHVQTLEQAAETVPGLRMAWLSALVGSTPVCLALHGATAPVGGVFEGPGWSGPRPPAIGQQATPSFHLCRSRVVPDHPDWERNPKLQPLSQAEIDHFKSKRLGGQGKGLREQDIPTRAKKQAALAGGAAGPGKRATE